MKKLTGIIAAFFVVFAGVFSSVGVMAMDMDDIGDTVYNVTHMLPTIDLVHGKIKKPHEVHDGSGTKLLVKEAKDQLFTDAVTGAAEAVVGKDIVHGVTGTLKVGERMAKVGYMAKKLAHKAHLYDEPGLDDNEPHPYAVDTYHGEDVHVPTPGDFGGGNVRERHGYGGW